MRIVTMSIFVSDQTRALAFYTDKLGFKKKSDFPAGPHRWLTVVSADAEDGVQISLEPDDHPAVKPFQEALVADGIPFTAFGVADIAKEHARLVRLGVTFTQAPTQMGPVITAVLDDTCGNLIAISQFTG